MGRHSTIDRRINMFGLSIREREDRVHCRLLHHCVAAGRVSCAVTGPIMAHPHLAAAASSLHWMTEPDLATTLYTRLE